MNQINDRPVVLNSSLLAGLHCFECAARHMSFTRAAEELHLTQGAVSHRIRKLEEQLQFKLFLRFNRQLKLSKEGQQLLQVLESSFGALETSIRDLRRQDVTGRLTLSSAPSFTVRWLAPRLGDFQQRHPGLLLNIETRDRQIDFRHEPVDVAIYYGDGHYPELHVVKLMDEQHIPVCTPKFADDHDLYGNPEKLAECLLLHDSSSSGKEDVYGEWRYWCQQAGLPEPDLSFSYCFNRTALSIASAENGQGLALGKYRLLAEDLDSGHLVAPFNISVPAKQSYYAVCHPDRLGQPSVRALMKWLEGQVGQEPPRQEPEIYFK